MAKLVFGNTKQNAVIAVVKEKQPVIDTLNVTPTTSAQTITAPSGTDGYSPVNVSAVDASIDANIVAGNIKSGVSILGVNGSVVELNGTTTSVTPTTSAQTITPTSPNNGFTEVSVSAVTSAIDANIQAGNIKQGVTILGVAGNYSGITPTGTLSITTNGTYDVTNYASADVNVPSSAPAHYIEKTVDANGKLQNSTTFINLNGITDFGPYTLAYAYAYAAFPANTKLDFSNITTITGNSALLDAFYYSSGIVEVDFSSLVNVSGTSIFNSAFFGCSQLTVVKLSSLKTIDGSGACNGMFNGCSGLISVDLSSLETVSPAGALSNMFQNCYGLTSVNLNGLNNIKQLSGQFAYLFNGCTHLESVTFGGLKASTFASAVNQLQYLFNNTTGSQTTNGCTVHFPSNFDPSDPDHTFDASTLTGYPTFGGSASYIHVAFDLPATE